jgi:hypothetical protein
MGRREFSRGVFFCLHPTGYTAQFLFPSFDMEHCAQDLACQDRRNLDESNPDLDLSTVVRLYPPLSLLLDDNVHLIEVGSPYARPRKGEKLPTAPPSLGPV